MLTGSTFHAEVDTFARIEQQAVQARGLESSLPRLACFSLFLSLLSLFSFVLFDLFSAFIASMPLHALP